MLSPRAIAMQGVGSAVLAFALQGLWCGVAAVPTSRREVVRLSSAITITVQINSTV